MGPVGLAGARSPPTPGAGTEGPSQGGGGAGPPHAADPPPGWLRPPSPSTSAAGRGAARRRAPRRPARAQAPQTRVWRRAAGGDRSRLPRSGRRSGGRTTFPVRVFERIESLRSVWQRSGAPSRFSLPRTPQNLEAPTRPLGERQVARMLCSRCTRRHPASRARRSTSAPTDDRDRPSGGAWEYPGWHRFDFPVDSGSAVCCMAAGILNGVPGQSIGAGDRIVSICERRTPDGGRRV